MPSVATYLATTPSRDLRRPQLDDTVEQFSAQLERAKAFKTVTVASQQ